MSSAHHILAIRYAHAFLNIFGDTITIDNFESLCLVSRCFKKYKLDLALDGSSEMIQICRNAGIPISFEKLVQLLAQTHRLSLFPEVLVQVCEQYKLRHGIITCSITSSHALTEYEKKTLHLFLERATKCKLIEQYGIDDKLIAGIRIVGNGVFWEYSVRRYLSEVSRQLIC